MPVPSSGGVHQFQYSHHAHSPCHILSVSPLVPANLVAGPSNSSSRLQHLVESSPPPATAVPGPASTVAFLPVGAPTAASSSSGSHRSQHHRLLVSQPRGQQLAAMLVPAPPPTGSSTAALQLQHCMSPPRGVAARRRGGSSTAAHRFQLEWSPVPARRGHRCSISWLGSSPPPWLNPAAAVPARMTGRRSTRPTRSQHAVHPGHGRRGTPAAT